MKTKAYKKKIMYLNKTNYSKFSGIILNFDKWAGNIKHNACMSSIIISLKTGDCKCCLNEYSLLNLVILLNLLHKGVEQNCQTQIVLRTSICAYTVLGI